MCGIFTSLRSAESKDFLREQFMKIQHRGPDHSTYLSVSDDIDFGFHRLAVNGLTAASHQPFHQQDCWIIANAEIFNYKELAAEHDIVLKTESDCEILIPLYRAIGLEAMIEKLDAEYAFALYDMRTDELIIARDHLGIRGLYVGKGEGDDLYWSSEAKAISFCTELEQFPTGCYWSSAQPDTYVRHYHHDYPISKFDSEEVICDGIRKELMSSIERRMMSDRPVGCFLSGGLDSSLVSALVARHFDDPKKLETFSIGLEGSPDLHHAQMVADHIGSTHHSVVKTESEFLDAIDAVIYTTGSYDVTTIRASVGHYLISQYVKEHSDVRVVFTGETIDEMGSYLYFQQAPSPEAFQAECTRLLEDIHYFDMLRGDRSISSAGIEARVPFASKSFVKFYMSIPPEQRMFNNERIEKYLLRKAFSDMDILPKEVLWRRKNGFSDSVSQRDRSWSSVIQEYVDLVISDEEFDTERFKYKQNTPQIKEAYYYRKRFEAMYGKHEVTPYMWLPKWCGDMVEPSARALSIYEAD